MVNSMTGYGQGMAEKDGSIFKVEMRAVNNRFLEVIIKAPRSLMALEEPIKKLVAARAARGRVEVFIRLEGEPPWLKLAVNKALAGQYVRALEELKAQYKLSGEPSLGMVAGYRDVISLSEEDFDAEAYWPLISQAVETALDNFSAMRAEEGRRLKEDIDQRLDYLLDFVKQVEENLPALVAESADRIRERVARLLEQEPDPDRLALEAAVLADKSDVTEEVVRLKSHVAQFKTALSEGGVIGRKLDFLAQEVHREINTIGSKSQAAEISGRVVEAKAEQEKIREQIQNIE